MNANGIGTLNLKVLLFDTDFYAIQSLNSYLAWDRRTRVTFLAETETEMWDYLNKVPIAERPDVVVLDSDHLHGADGLKKTIEQLKRQFEKINVMCLSQDLQADMLHVALEAGARGFLLKQEVRLQIAWAIVHMIQHELLISKTVAKFASQLSNPPARIQRATILPEQREYPELTDRIRQAIKLCVVEGMPAHLAADEMGISLHTIRGYIKEGYRILESYDESEYPTDMTPQERAFMRFTALANREDGDESADESEG